MKWPQFLSGVIIGLIILSSCKKQDFINSRDARVSFSADTLKFDTVFTSVGSVTQSIKVFNLNDQKIRFSEISLMGGSSSFFHLNINGANVNTLRDIELAANDSLYVFVNITVDPNAASLPFIISDSIKIAYNGVERFVQLQAYGQNAHFLRGVELSADTEWTNDLPYVILGGLKISSAVTLTIQEGCRVHCHADAPIIVNGSLKCNGTKANPVRFISDRLDDPYRYFPASWPGIILTGSSVDNRFRFTEIRNAYQGIVMNGPSTNVNPKLVLHQCIIDNVYDAGIISMNSSIAMDNTLVSNCGKNLQFLGGGNYQLTNCTIAAFSNNYIYHSNPVLTLSNLYEDLSGTINEPLTASITNCIFWGSENDLEDEVVVSKNGSPAYDVNFSHCIYKGLHEPANSNLSNNIQNEYPAFDSIDVIHEYYDFHITLDPLAPGVNQGTNTSFPTDLDDLPRTVEITDIGAYEKQ